MSSVRREFQRVIKKERNFIYKNNIYFLQRKTVGDLEIDEIPPNVGKSSSGLAESKVVTKSIAPQAKNDLIDLDDILGGSTTTNVNMTNSTGTNKNLTDSSLNLLGDLLIGGGPTITNNQPAVSNPMNDLLNLYGGSSQPQMNTQLLQQQQQPQGVGSLLGLSFPVNSGPNPGLLQTQNLSTNLFEGESLVSGKSGNTMTAFEDENLEIVFELSKVVFYTKLLF
jgi:hypothetical protein